MAFGRLTGRAAPTAGRRASALCPINMRWSGWEGQFLVWSLGIAAGVPPNWEGWVPSGRRAMSGTDDTVRVGLIG